MHHNKYFGFILQTVHITTVDCVFHQFQALDHTYYPTKIIPLPKNFFLQTNLDLM